jgi:hypothetical protein
MEIDVNLQESLRGLWLGRGPGSYLTKFFPRLDVGRPHLVPVRSGFNVLYGRNGAGKTQILNALAAASQWEMGPLEGFLLEDPAWSHGWREGETRFSELSGQEVLDAICDAESSEVRMGYSWRFQKGRLGQERLPEVFAIINEFRRAKTVLVTRGLREVSLVESEDGARKDLLPPHSLELVPVLLPDSEAPATRGHLAEMRASLRTALKDAFGDLGYIFEPLSCESWDFEDAMGRSMADVYFGGEDKRAYNEVLEAIDFVTNRWCERWSWSPLFNARNIGEPRSNIWDHPIEFEALALHSSVAAIFLPPVHGETSDAYSYSDFSRATVQPVFTPFQEKESRSAAGDSVDLLQYPDPRHFWPGKSGEVGEEVEESATMYFAERLATLKARLRFLPRFSSALFVGSQFGSPPKAHLMIGPGIRASAGSRAEVRWLEFALAVHEGWVFFDEPEAGLHRTAESDLAMTLISPAWSGRGRSIVSGPHRSGRTIVVATHSPEFLDLPDANILHVDEGRARLLTPFDRESLSILGLRPADLLSRVKTWLLVEGEHERIVLETLFSEELKRLRVSIVVARGGKNMRDIFDSQVLFSFSDARVVALLDNVRARHVQDLWRRARDLASKGRIDEAGELVRGELPPQRSSENLFLGQFLSRALQEGEHERFDACGLSKSDIVLYLSPAAFGIKRSWQDALADYVSSRDGALKPWLSKKFGATFGPDEVRAGLESLDEIPQDFLEVLSALEIAHT